MEHAANTKNNDSVTNRQFHRFLANAQLPLQWQGKVKHLEDVLRMPVIYQDQLFADWHISHFLGLKMY